MGETSTCEYEGQERMNMKWSEQTGGKHRCGGGEKARKGLGFIGADCAHLKSTITQKLVFCVATRSFHARFVSGWK